VLHALLVAVSIEPKYKPIHSRCLVYHSVPQCAIACCIDAILDATQQTHTRKNCYSSVHTVSERQAPHTIACSTLLISFCHCIYIIYLLQVEEELDVLRDALIAARALVAPLKEAL
jgi:hypothetical protein